MDINDIIINEDKGLKEGLNQLDKIGLGVLFVVDKKYKLCGIVTDGDIRRYLIDKSNLDIEIKNVMNTNYTALSINSNNSKILNELNSKIKIIPLLNEKEEVVDYASINRLRKIPIASPLLKGNELAYLTECIKTNWISSQGKYVRQFESLFSDFHEGRHSLAVSNGTVALHLALEALGIGEGDEVIVPNLTFAASINAIIYTGAIPVLAEVKENTFNIDVDEIEELISKKTKAIMLVHLYGQPCDMNAIMSIAKKYNLLILEDAAEALGSTYEDQPVGIFGDAATFSFFGNKTITTGEGGMILFKDKKVAEKASILRDHGMSKEKRYWHDFVGYNYRLTNMQAAIGVAQFERLDQFLKVKRLLAQKYNEVLANSPFFKIQDELSNTQNSYWLYTFLIQDNAPFSREDLMKNLKDRGVETRPVFYPLNVMPPYKKYGKDREFPVSSKVSKQGVSLPSSANLSLQEIDYICDVIREFVEKNNI